jgi:DmsE family decaheme c-type cytochrome
VLTVQSLFWTVTHHFQSPIFGGLGNHSSPPIIIPFMEAPLTSLTLCMLLSFCLLGGDGDQLTEDRDGCMECHDDQLEFVLKTPHREAFNVACADCHGKNEEHFEEPTVDNIQMPNGVSGEKVCLACHQEKHLTVSVDSHQTNGVNCSDCHRAHPANPTGATSHALLKPSDNLCAECHFDKKPTLSRPFSHKQGHGTEACTSCHNPHGQKDQSLVGRDAANLCLSCHKEKRGPFVFEHVAGLEGDCLSCHEAHDAATPMRLVRSRVDLLCLECHSDPQNTLGSQPPAVHDLRSPRYRQCTTCHTAIHGSNHSPLFLK